MKPIGAASIVALVFLMGFLAGQYLRPKQEGKIIVGTASDGKVISLCSGDCSWGKIVRKLDQGPEISNIQTLTLTEEASN